MEVNSQIKVLESQIRESYGKLVWTYTTHQKCTDILIKKSKSIKIIKIVFNAISTTGLVSYLVMNQKWLPFVSAIFATISLGLDIYTLSNDMDKEINMHVNMVNKLWDIREKYLSLLTDIKIGILNTEEIIFKRDELQNDLSYIYKSGPRTNSKAYKIASKALKNNEDMTLHDEEIDLFLPNDLKRKKQ